MSLAAHRLRVALFMVASVVIAATAGAQQAFTPGAFEDDAVGQAPNGWFVPTPEFKATVEAGSAKAGKQCVKLAGGGKFGNLMQAVDATPYREKRVRYRAAVRVESGGGRAQLWLREDRASGEMGFFDNMSARPIGSGEWQYYEITGNIGADAKALALGVMSLEGATVWFDDATLEVLGPSTKKPSEAGRAVEARGLENLTALARLVGCVRYFHPTDEAAKVDWDSFVVNAVKKVESAKDAAALATALREQFAPIAPTVEIFAGAAKGDGKIEAPKAERGELSVTMWKHNGLGGGAGKVSIYSSSRQKAKYEAGKLPEGYEDPTTPLTLDLGGGVGCRLAVSVFADEGGTLPRGKIPAALDADELTADDRAVRIAAVIEAWNVLQHFYPYFDVVKTDWPAALQDGLSGAAAAKDARGGMDVLRELVAKVKDGHGYVGHASDRALASLPLAWEWIEGKLVITAVGDECALVSKALKPGAVVAKVNGVDASAALAEQEKRISGATAQWKRWTACQWLARTAMNENVKLEIVDEAGKNESVSLGGAARERPVAEERPEKIAELKPGVWYVDVERLAAGDMKANAEKLAKAKGVIFDMRGYPGSDEAWKTLSYVTTSVVQSPQWNVPQVVLPDGRKTTFNKSSWPVGALTPHFEGKIAFLTDGRAISAAETYMGIVEYYKLGAIVGGPTAGTNGNVNPMSLVGGYSMVWTGMKVLKQDGSQHHGVGILPTVPVSRTIAGVAAGRDEVLEKGVEVVTKP